LAQAPRGLLLATSAARRRWAAGEQATAPLAARRRALGLTTEMLVTPL
jgi:hypothetical protein